MFAVGKRFMAIVAVNKNRLICFSAFGKILLLTANVGQRLRPLTCANPSGRSRWATIYPNCFPSASAMTLHFFIMVANWSKSNDW